MSTSLPNLVEVIPRLFLGSLQDANNRELLESHKITQLLSVGAGDPPKSAPSMVSITNAVDVDDEDYVNIMKHFPRCNSVISACIGNSEERILVYCTAGMSRSPTVVAAFLMQLHTIDAARALEMITALRPVIRPNDGFLKQLDIYHDIQYDVDPKNLPYRRFLMDCMAFERATNGYVEDYVLGVDPETLKGSPASLVARTSGSDTSSNVGALRCRKCRRALVSAENIIAHEPGSGQVAFAYRKRDQDMHLAPASSDPTANSSSCSSFFVEPLEWIDGLRDGQIEGQKIACPKCDAKLGSYKWSGMQCSCGSWVTPAFVLHRNRVDVLRA